MAGPSGLQPPTPYTWSVGDVESAALLNAQIRDMATFWQSPPMFEAIQTATFTIIPSQVGPWTSLTWADTAGILVDNYGGHSTSANPTQYQGQVPGWYWVSGVTCFPSSSTGNRGVRLAKNGSAVQAGATIIGGAAVSQATVIATPTRKVFLNGSTDYLELQAIQNSGASLTTATGADIGSAFSIHWAHA